MRRSADEDDRAVLDVGQEDVLLGGVEAVQFVDEEHRPPAALPLPEPRALDDLADLLDAGCGGV